MLEKLSAENISKQIDGARCLEELGIHSVNIKADISKSLAYHTYIHWTDGKIMRIIKYYSNGEVVYRRDEQHSYDDWEKYYTDISFLTDSGNFVIDFDTVGNNFGCKTATVTDFGFDTSLLPSEEELSRMDVPKSLADSKVYVKLK